MSFQAPRLRIRRTDYQPGEFDDIEEKMGEILSSLEWEVLMAYLEGKSYQEIAVDLRRHVKSIDNALQRVKRKLERYLEHRGA
jgi:RNA polymerase sporulation-specific sigma factor